MVTTLIFSSSWIWDDQISIYMHNCRLFLWQITTWSALHTSLCTDQTSFRTKGNVLVFGLTKWKIKKCTYTHNFSYSRWLFRWGRWWRRDGGNQQIMSNTQSTTNLWSVKKWRHLYTILIVDTFSLSLCLSYLYFIPYL